MPIFIEFISLQADYLISCILTPARFLTISYADFSSTCLPLPHATSIAWRMALKQTFWILSKVTKAINFSIPINIYWFYLKMFIGMILRDFS